jgi:hypothetical protein
MREIMDDLRRTEPLMGERSTVAATKILSGVVPTDPFSFPMIVAGSHPNAGVKANRGLLTDATPWVRSIRITVLGSESNDVILGRDALDNTTSLARDIALASPQVSPKYWYLVRNGEYSSIGFYPKLATVVGVSRDIQVDYTFNPLYFDQALSYEVPAPAHVMILGMFWKSLEEVYGPDSPDTQAAYRAYMIQKGQAIDYVRSTGLGEYNQNMQAV